MYVLRSSLPTYYNNNAKRRKLTNAQPPKQTKNIVYDREIVCLPLSFLQDGKVAIPRSDARDLLAANGLFGKIRFDSSMTEDTIFMEIRSVFKEAMFSRPDFPFTILQPAGGGSKFLTVPALSATYQWTASAVNGKNTKMPIYILAEEDLKVGK